MLKIGYFGGARGALPRPCNSATAWVVRCAKIQKKCDFFKPHKNTHDIGGTSCIICAFSLLALQLLALQSKAVVAHIIVESVYVLHLLHTINENTLAQSVVYLHRSASPPPYRRSRQASCSHRRCTSLHFARGRSRAYSL